MSHSFYSLFTTINLIWMFIGMGLVCAWYWNYCRKLKESIDWIPMGIIAGFATIVFVVMQNQGLAYEVKACNTEFQTILSQRASITDEADDYLGGQLDSTVDWLSLVVEPPPDILNLPSNDPKRRAWVIDTKRDWRHKIDEAKQARKDAIAERKNHQYPEPQCGK